MDTSDSSNNEVASAEEPSSLEEKPEDPSSGSESDTSSDNGGQQPHKFGISTRHDEFLLEDFESDDDLKQNASDKYIELWDPISEFESQKREFNLVEREFMALWSTWTVEEQRKFISALGRFGKYSAHLIASKIATKSTVQVGVMISYFERLSEYTGKIIGRKSIPMAQEVSQASAEVEDRRVGVKDRSEWSRKSLLEIGLPKISAKFIDWKLSRQYVDGRGFDNIAKRAVVAATIEFIRRVVKIIYSLAVERRYNTRGRKSDIQLSYILVHDADIKKALQLEPTAEFALTDLDSIDIEADKGENDEENYYNSLSLVSARSSQEEPDDEQDESSDLLSHDKDTSNMSEDLFSSSKTKRKREERKAGSDSEDDTFPTQPKSILSSDESDGDVFAPPPAKRSAIV